MAVVLPVRSHPGLGRFRRCDFFFSAYCPWADTHVNTFVQVRWDKGTKDRQEFWEHVIQEQTKVSHLLYARFRSCQ
jgi:hypothetical protein